MNILILLLSTIIAAILQYYLPGWSFFADSKYPFLYAVVIYFGLYGSVQFLILAAIIAGGMCDILSRMPLGYSCILFGLAAFLLRCQTSDFSEEGVVFSASLFGGILIFVIIIIEYFLLKERNMINFSFSYGLIKGIGNGLQALFVIPLTLHVVGYIDKSLTGNSRRRNDRE